MEADRDTLPTFWVYLWSVQKNYGTK